MSEWTDPRPMSPHLWSWRWHLTMVTSILHRLTGFSNIAALLLLVAWLGAIADGPRTHALYTSWVSTWPVQAILALCAVGLVFHLVNGIRYLLWDLGRGLAPPVASLFSAFHIIAAIAGGGALWYLL